MSAEGYVAPGFEGVRAAFERNFAEHGELGAVFAVYQDGRLVVDLWGGVADRASGRSWTRETLQSLFSGTKGLVALCILMLVERGQLALDQPVADVWPEFAASGKERIRVRDVVSHQARLPGIETPLTLEDQTDAQRMAELLAGQAPSDDPRATLCYHGLTYGWLCGEILRRIDGRTIGRFFADEVATPLDLEVWIGLPEREEPRVATLELATDWPAISPEAFARDRLLWAARGNPDRYDRATFPWNSRAYRAAEIPGGNAIGTARSMARLYGCLALGGALDGVRVVSESTLRLGRVELSRGRDGLADTPTAFGVGFALPTELAPPAIPPDAFGHPGAGGSRHEAWPSDRVGCSYAMNLMRQDPDPRGNSLQAALRAALRPSPVR